MLFKIKLITNSLISQKLPIEEVLDKLKEQLCLRDEVILQAPPGAGKTTLVPLALMGEPWLKGKKILMLEPRRLATKTAAHRISSLINESPGESVGYRMRLDTNVSDRTVIEIITEGILTRMLQSDPALSDVGLVIFDEFHERSLDSDLALALCLHGRSLFREDPEEPLKILLMSATLETVRASELLDNAPIVQSLGKLYSVDIFHGAASKPRDSIVDRTVTTVIKALDENLDSSILVFLPGQGEISRVTEALADWISSKKIRDIHLRPLYGNLSIEEQQNAIAPLKTSGHRKVVIATNIAETSLTIEGIDVVVDSGLAREPVFDPSTGMTRLQTRKISRASSIQRMGRAGRLRPGRCYRLWSADQQQQLAAHAEPEILQADLAPLALQLLQWGINDPAELSWLDAPPTGAWSQAIELLTALGALQKTDTSLVLTQHGKAMTTLPVHPRLAHLLVCGVKIREVKIACALASILSDRDPFRRPEISYRLAILDGQITCPPANRGWLRRSQQLAKQFEQQVIRLGKLQDDQSLPQDQLAGYLLSCAYPDRVARRRHAGGFQLANGRSANFDGHHLLGKEPWLAIAEVGGIARSKGDTIRSAAPLNIRLFESLLSHLVDNQTIAEWDKKTKRFIGENRKVIGALTLEKRKLDAVPLQAKADALIQHIRDQGLDLLPWSKELRQWQARVMLVKTTLGFKSWPDLSDAYLLENLEDWLAPYLEPVTQISHFKKLALKDILFAQLPWEQSQQLKHLVPERYKVPTGSRYQIDYTQSPPVLAVKLQEMFGCKETPTIANGKVSLLIHLLSPAGRPLQVTQDLAGFWKTSYQDVKKEMKGRYPKHRWPDDP